MVATNHLNQGVVSLGHFEIEWVAPSVILRYYYYYAVFWIGNSRFEGSIIAPNLVLLSERMGEMK